MASSQRLGSVLHALRARDAADELSIRSAEFSAGGETALAPDHPSFGSAPDEWKNEPDMESAARFTPSGRFTRAEEETLRHELRYFREHGCIMIPDALVGEQLIRARLAYDRVLASARDAWKSADPASRGAFQPDLPGTRVLELEDDLLALLETPRMLPLLSQCVGEDLQCTDAFLRYNPGGGDPAGPRFKGGWHRDTANHHNNATGRSLALKVFFYFYDMEENGGTTALVPRTHLSDIHPRVLSDQIKADMPGAVMTPGRAGSALIFDKRTWHSRTINSQPIDEARRCMTIIYSTWLHKNEKMRTVGERLDAAGKLTPLARQLMGLEQLYSERRASPTAVDGVWMARSELEPQPQPKSTYS